MGELESFLCQGRKMAVAYLAQQLLRLISPALIDSQQMQSPATKDFPIPIPIAAQLPAPPLLPFPGKNPRGFKDEVKKISILSFFFLKRERD